MRCQFFAKVLMKMQRGVPGRYVATPVALEERKEAALFFIQVGYFNSAGMLSEAAVAVCRKANLIYVVGLTYLKGVD